MQAPPSDELPFAVDGLVKDHLGNPLDNVEVNITNLDTGETKDTTSTDIGYYGAVLSEGVSQGNTIRVTAQGDSDQKVVDHVLTEQEAESAGVMINITFEESVQTTTPPPTTTEAPTTSPPPTTHPSQTTTLPPQTTVPPTTTTQPPNNDVNTTNPPTTQYPSDTTMPPETRLTTTPVSVTTQPPSDTELPTTTPSDTTVPPSNEHEGEGGTDYFFILAVCMVAVFGVYVINELRKR